MSAVCTLAIFLLSIGLFGLTFTQIETWSAVWAGWLDSPQGPDLTGDQIAYLKQLPTAIVVGHVLVILAMASPFALRFGR